MNKKETGNREYKDNVFRLLFGNAEKSAELYNAIRGTNYTADDVEINTLQNPFFFGVLRNDLSFTIKAKLINLTEHQSSINPNMGLRFLLYSAEIYGTSIDKKDMYKPAPMSIATPEFYVLYNGAEDCPEKSIIRLSDLYKVQGVENTLELTVTVYNVNKGYNKNIMTNSRTLSEYAEFVAKVREYSKNSNTTESLKRAIEDCVRNDILREFLLQYGGEIVNLLNREFDIDIYREAMIETGEDRRAERIAERMLLENEPVDKIIRYTGLTQEKIIKIIKKIK